MVERRGGGQVWLRGGTRPVSSPDQTTCLTTIWTQHHPLRPRNTLDLFLMTLLLDKSCPAPLDTRNYLLALGSNEKNPWNHMFRQASRAQQRPRQRCWGVLSPHSYIQNIRPWLTMPCRIRNARPAEDPQTSPDSGSANALPRRHHVLALGVCWN